MTTIFIKEMGMSPKNAKDAYQITSLRRDVKMFEEKRCNQSDLTNGGDANRIKILFKKEK
jgi:hypothetical protein